MVTKKLGLLWVLAAAFMALGCKNQQTQSNSSGNTGNKPCLRVDPVTKEIIPEGAWVKDLPENTTAYAIQVDPKHIKDGKLQYSDELDFGTQSVGKDGKIGVKFPENAKQYKIDKQGVLKPRKKFGKDLFCSGDMGPSLVLVMGGSSIGTFGGALMFVNSGDKRKWKKFKQPAIKTLAISAGILVGYPIVGAAVMLFCSAGR